jgi:hypothetical protein
MPTTIGPSDGSDIFSPSGFMAHGDPLFVLSSMSSLNMDGFKY